MKKLSFSDQAKRSKTPLVWDYAVGHSRSAVFFRCDKGHPNMVVCPPYKISTTAKTVGTVYPTVKCNTPKCGFASLIILEGWGT